MTTPPASSSDIAFLARRAGLDLSAEHLAELADAYRHVEPMLARIRRNRALSDEPAHIFNPALFAPRDGDLR